MWPAQSWMSSVCERAALMKAARLSRGVWTQRERVRRRLDLQKVAALVDSSSNRRSCCRRKTLLLLNILHTYSVCFSLSVRLDYYSLLFKSHHLGVTDTLLSLKKSKIPSSCSTRWKYISSHASCLVITAARFLGIFLAFSFFDWQDGSCDCHSQH